MNLVLQGIPSHLRLGLGRVVGVPNANGVNVSDRSSVREIPPVFGQDPHLDCLPYAVSVALAPAMDSPRLAVLEARRVSGRPAEGEVHRLEIVGRDSWAHERALERNMRVSVEREVDRTMVCGAEEGRVRNASGSVEVRLQAREMRRYVGERSNRPSWGPR